MRFNDLRKIMRSMLDTGISMELVSSPGLGKSDVVAQTIEDQSRADGERWGFAKMFLATQTPPDLTGYKFKGEREFTDEHGATTKVAITEDTLPSWMMTVDGKPVTAFKRGILFLDEYGQGEADVKRASAELLLNRQIGPWKLPDGWSVIAASNRSSDRSGVTKSFDFVINRRIEINIDPDVDSWKDWAAEKNVNPLFIAFAVNNPQIVFAGKVPDKQAPWCTPRSLVMVSQMLARIGAAGGIDQSAKGDFKNIPTGPLATEISCGLIGEAATAQLLAFIRLGQEMPPFEDIIKDPVNTRIPDKPDGRMLVMYNLASRNTPEHAGALITYMKRMPKEFAVAFVQATLKRMPSLLNNPDFKGWVFENASLLAALGAQSGANV